MNFSSWLYAARPKTLVAAMIPVMSSILILPDISLIKFDIFVLTLIAAVLIQITTNYINDIYDFIKGADQNRLGPPRMVQSGKISLSKMKKAVLMIFIMGILCGIPLVVEGGWPIVFIGLTSFLFGYLYTAGPFPFAYNGLGDIFVFIYFGLVAVSGSYYLQTGFIDINSLLLGISIGSMNVMLLTINNIRDYQTDKQSNKNTLIVLLGKSFGKLEMIFLNILYYGSIYILSIKFKAPSVFFFILCGFPLSYSIIYDTIYKEGKALNNTLSKISFLLILHFVLLGIGIYI